MGDYYDKDGTPLEMMEWARIAENVRLRDELIAAEARIAELLATASELGDLIWDTQRVEPGEDKFAPEGSESRWLYRIGSAARSASRNAAKLAWWRFGLPEFPTHRMDGRDPFTVISEHLRMTAERDRLTGTLAKIRERCSTLEQDEAGVSWNAYEGETINDERAAILAIIKAESVDATGEGER